MYNIINNNLFSEKGLNMIAANFSTVRNEFKDFCDKVTDDAETVIVTRNVVIISADRYNEMEKAERNAAFLQKLDRGLKQVHAGHGITKSIAELEMMSDE